LRRIFQNINYSRKSVENLLRGANIELQIKTVTLEEDVKELQEEKRGKLI